MVTRLSRKGLQKKPRAKKARHRALVHFDSSQDAAAIDALFHAFAMNLGRKIASQSGEAKPRSADGSHPSHTPPKTGEAG